MEVDETYLLLTYAVIQHLDVTRWTVQQWYDYLLNMHYIVPYQTTQSLPHHDQI